MDQMRSEGHVSVVLLGVLHGTCATHWRRVVSETNLMALDFVESAARCLICRFHFIWGIGYRTQLAILERFENISLFFA